MKGQIENLFIKNGHGQPMTPVQELLTKSGKGIVGDKSYGRKKRQVLLIDVKTLDHFGLEPGLVRENITVSNMPLNSLDPGMLLQAGEASLEITGDCAPCHQIDDIRPGLRTKMEKRRGILCIVREGGKVAVGDSIKLMNPLPG